MLPSLLVLFCCSQFKACSYSSCSPQALSLVVLNVDVRFSESSHLSLRETWRGPPLPSIAHVCRIWRKTERRGEMNIYGVSLGNYAALNLDPQGGIGIPARPEGSSSFGLITAASPHCGCFWREENLLLLGEEEDACMKMASSGVTACDFFVLKDSVFPHAGGIKDIFGKSNVSLTSCHSVDLSVIVWDVSRWKISDSGTNTLTPSSGNVTVGWTDMRPCVCVLVEVVQRERDREGAR